MNTRATSFLCLLLLLLVAAAGELRAAQPAAGSRVVFGVVPTAAATAEQGVPVDKVAPGSPAEKAGLRSGDIILRINGVQMQDKNTMRDYVASCSPGEVLRVNYRRGTAPRVALVELDARAATVPAAAPAQQHITVPYEIRVQMRQARARIRFQLASLPHRMNPSAVVADLRELQNLALSLQGGSRSPQASAGEAELEFADAVGKLILHTQNRMLTLIVQDAAGHELARYPLNSLQECRALPRTLVRRLQAL